MNKHLKDFDKYANEYLLRILPYQINDYVIVVDVVYNKYTKQGHDSVLKTGKVTSIEIKDAEISSIKYTIEFSDGSTKKYDLDQIGCSAKPKEITEYELEKSNPEEYAASKKYNL